MSQFTVIKRHADDNSVCVEKSVDVADWMDATTRYADTLMGLFGLSDTAVGLMSDWMEAFANNCPCGRDDCTNVVLQYNWDYKHTITFAYVA